MVVSKRKVDPTKSSSRPIRAAKVAKKEVKPEEETSESEARAETSDKEVKEYIEEEKLESDVPSEEPSDSEVQLSFVKDDSGGYYMDLPGAGRRMSVRSFKGKTYIDIREFYEKDGKLLPGKKGISLTPEQWKAIKNSAEDVDKCINRV